MKHDSLVVFGPKDCTLAEALWWVGGLWWVFLYFSREENH